MQPTSLKLVKESAGSYIYRQPGFVILSNIAVTNNMQVTVLLESIDY